MRWPQIVTVLLGVLIVAFAVRSRREQAERAAAGVPPATAPFDLGRPLPPSFDQPGLVSRQIGLLRVYVTVVPEVTLDVSAAPAARPAATVPITLTFENDTYQPLAGSAIGWLGENLCQVRILRATDDRDAEVFQHDVPLLARADWLSAERRSVMIHWPVRGAAPGLYRVSVQLALPGQPPLEITTRLL